MGIAREWAAAQERLRALRAERALLEDEFKRIEFEIADRDALIAEQEAIIRELEANGEA